MKLPIVAKRILKITGISLLLLLGAAIAIPYFFKDKIVEKNQKGHQRRSGCQSGF